MIRRFLVLALVAFASIAGASFWTSRLLLLWLIGLYAVVHVRYQPFLAPNTNRLETVSLFSLFVVSGGMCSEAMSEETFGSYGSPLHVTLITIVLVTTIGLLIALITPTLRSFYTTVSDKLKPSVPNRLWRCCD